MSKPNDDGSLATSDVRLFETGNFADATIVCGDRTWKVHKIILGSRCKWFERAFFGSLAEAVSGKIVLEEQDPDVVDMMLRFIYAKTINIAKLANGKDIPALSVRIFRLADFFLLHELKDKAMTELREHLNKILPINEGNVQDPKSSPACMRKVEEVFKSIKEAYQDDGTSQTRDVLLKFLWMRNASLFHLPEMTVLIGEVPDFGRDLMLKYIRFGATTYLPGMNKPPAGLIVLEAIRAPKLIYKRYGKETNTEATDKAPCLLRHTPGRPSPFEVVNAETGETIRDLDWLNPATSLVTRFVTNATSSIVCIRLLSAGNDVGTLRLRFENLEDAQYYVKCHTSVDGGVGEENIAHMVMERQMRGVRDLVTRAAQSSSN